MEKQFKPQQCLIKVTEGNNPPSYQPATYTGFSRSTRKHLFILANGTRLDRDNLHGISFDELSQANNLQTAVIHPLPEKRRSWR